MSTLFGRELEQRQLVELLNEARLATARSIVITGEPGIGKSALLDWISRQAAGCRVLHVRGHEADMTTSHLVLRQVLRPIIEHLDCLDDHLAENLRSAIGLTGTACNEGLVPLAALELLSSASDTSPIVLLLDDAHWFDHASLSTLSFVARRAMTERIFLAFAVRPHDVAQPRLLQALPHLELVGLAARASEAVLESSGRVLSPETMRQCNGNPLALLHVSSEPATARGHLGTRQQLPARLQADFRRTLQKLPADCRIALGMLAVAGSVPTEVSTRALALLGVGGDALEPAVDAGVVAADGTFRHPLWGAAAMPERTDAAAVHDALADAYHDDERLALLHRLLGTGPYPDELFTTSQALGDRLLADGHVDDAHALFVAAAGTDNDSGRRALAWAKAGQCLSVSERWAEAAPFYERALNDAEAAPTKLRVLRELVWVQVLAGGTVGAAAARLRRSLYTAVAHTSLERVRLAEAWGSLVGLYLVSDVHRALAAEGDIPAEVGALGEILMAHCLANSPRGRSARNQIRAHAVAGEGDVHGLFAVSGFHVELLEMEGSWSECAAGSKGYYDEVRATHQLHELGPALSRRVSSSVFLGDATTAFGYALAAMEHAPQECTVLGYSSFAAAVVGSPHADEWAVRCERVASSTGLTEHVVKANHRRGFACMASDDLAAAEPFMRQCWQLLLTQGYAHPGWAFARGDIAETFARLALVDDARAVIAELETGPFDLAWARGVAARARGFLGERGQFEVALDLLADSPWETARTQLAWARHIRRSDSAHSRALAEAAGHGFEAMGARPWATQARGVSTPSAETPDPMSALLPELSDRERTVALTVARGLSNKEVAAELFISMKTVDAHLQQIYRKLDIRSRSQLTAIALGATV